ncbi:MAG: hypothetical protein JNM63_12835, partial [Spirochaetia bacterium]|nr:hypothetical protein [Spirochaetia bacterium]
SHSEAPVYFKRKFENDPQTLRRVDDAYRGMDNTFTTELSKYNNVYIDLFLQKEERADASYADRIRVTEKAMERFSQPAQGELAPYHSMEPLIEEYARNARPVPVNVEPDRDSKVRSFPLAFTISNSDGMVRKYFSIVMEMLLEYYRVPQEFVSIQKDKIVLNAAKVPSLNKKTRQQLIKEVPLEKVTGKLAGRSKNERYNRNLYQLIVNDFSLVYADDPDKVPYFPVQLLVKDGKFEVLDGQEIIDAAIAVGSKKIKIVEYTEKDVVIRTDFTFFPHTFLINYGAKDEQGYKDPATGRPVSYKAIPTVSYNDIYSMERLPEIPALGGDKRIAASYDTTYLKDWFFNTQLPKQIPKFQRAVFNKYKAYDGDKALEYASKEDPFLGKYYFYRLYLQNVSPVPASLAAMEASYAAFIKDYGLTQDKDQYLSEKNILAALQENYSDRFGQYYNKFIFTGVNGTGAAHDIHETPLGKMFGINAIIYAFSTIVT